MGRDSLIRRLKRSASRHAIDGGLVVLFAIALAVGAPAAFSGLGKFVAAITPSIAAEASDRISVANRPRVVSSNPSPLSLAAHSRLLVEDLVDRNHTAKLQQRLDHLGCLHRHLLRQGRDSDGLRHQDFVHDRLGR